MRNLLSFLKIGLILHVATSLWFGIFCVLVSYGGVMLEGFIKGALFGPLVLGGPLYVGSLAFSTVAIYFLHNNKE